MTQINNLQVTADGSYTWASRPAGPWTGATTLQPKRPSPAASRLMATSRLPCARRQAGALRRGAWTDPDTSSWVERSTSAK